jgi:hypothetical protein
MTYVLNISGGSDDLIDLEGDGFYEESNNIDYGDNGAVVTLSTGDVLKIEIGEPDGIWNVAILERSEVATIEVVDSTNSPVDDDQGPFDQVARITTDEPIAWVHIHPYGDEDAFERFKNTGRVRPLNA